MGLALERVNAYDHKLNVYDDGERKIRSKTIAY
jgi:hypothetical protein